MFKIKKTQINSDELMINDLIKDKNSLIQRKKNKKKINSEIRPYR